MRQTTDDQLKMTVTDDCAVSACNPPPLFIKALTLHVAGRKSAFGQMSATLPLWFPASEIKQTFLSIDLASLLASEWQAARPPPHILFQ